MPRFSTAPARGQRGTLHGLPLSHLFSAAWHSPQRPLHNPCRISSLAQSHPGGRVAEPALSERSRSGASAFGFCIRATTAIPVGRYTLERCRYRPLLANCRSCLLSAAVLSFPP